MTFLGTQPWEGFKHCLDSPRNMTLHFTALFWQTGELSISVNISSALWLLEFLIGSEFRIYLFAQSGLEFRTLVQWDEPFSEWIILFAFPEINVKDYKIQDLFCRESSLSQETGWNAFWRSILNSIYSMLMPKFLRDFLFNIRSIIVITKVAWIFYKRSCSFRNYFNLIYCSPGM